MGQTFFYNIIALHMIGHLYTDQFPAPLASTYGSNSFLWEKTCIDVYSGRTHTAMFTKAQIYNHKLSRNIFNTLRAFNPQNIEN